jgi:hypothetical protein
MRVRVENGMGKGKERKGKGKLIDEVNGLF